MVKKKYTQVKRAVKKKVQTVKTKGVRAFVRAQSLSKAIAIVGKIGAKKAKTQLKTAISKSQKKYVERKLQETYRAQKNWKSICSGASSLGTGVVDGIASNLSFGIVGTIGKNEEANKDSNMYYIGKILTDAGTMLIGNAGVPVGLAMTGGGGIGTVASAGTASVPGIALSAAGIGVISGSIGITVSGGKNLIQDSKDLFSNIKKGNESKEAAKAGIAKDFEKKISKMSPNERVASVKQMAKEIAEKKGLTKNSKLSKINKRDIYTDEKNKEFYSVDTQHGRFEKTNAKGKHQGEVDFDFNNQKPADKSGKHDIRVK
ncbi:colicin E3/pyocin S6 family cytotoxin [Listeria booriae]|uniref:colicin E3/pyocin S6 family cytotoxin n=1 Tax=Listeria booriae TaxID=1552123 RepID=UPI002892C40E|nr:colicin E3/pyocin S6 family cytotoxin [Listeria booriae]